MRRYVSFIAYVVAVMGFCMPTSKALADCHHSKGKTKGNFFGSVRLGLDPVFICDNTALGVFGEVGPRIYRISGTLGVFANDCQRFKIGAEFLGQKLKYNFSSGRVHEWMHQYAVGGVYQYLMDCNSCIRGIQLAGHYSHAQDRTLKSHHCESENRSVLRRIAGSWGMNAEAGLILAPWECGNLIASLGYDQVRYHRHFHGKKRVSGLGVSLELNHRFRRNLTLNVRTEFRRPYNYAEFLLSWNRCCPNGDISVGIFGGYLWGKDSLPCSSNAGVEIRYAFGIDKCNICSNSCCNTDCCACPCDIAELADWVASPAVFMPQVLAIPDEGSCNGPTASNIGTIEIPCGPINQDLSQFFSGSNLKFSASNLPAGVTISSSGVLGGVNPGIGWVKADVQITASNGCGSVTKTACLILCPCE